MRGRILSKSEISDREAKMNTKASGIRLLSVVWLGALGVSLCCGLAMAAQEPHGDKDHPGHSTAEDFLRLSLRPLPSRHHGLGPNGGQKPPIPLDTPPQSVTHPQPLPAP